MQPNNHRTPAQQAQLSQPTTGFMQQRQNTFPFAGTLGQTQAGQAQHPTSTLQGHSTNLQTSSQQQSNGTSSSLPPHLTQNANTPSLGGTAPSVSSASDVGLDPNDFPALGSTPASTNNTSNGNAANNVTTSYASQAGTALGGAAASTTSGTGNGSNSQTRDFTPDDFPALGGQPSSHPPNSSSQSQSQGQDTNHPHPPGLNGFQHNDHSQQHRQNLLGSLGGLQTPGMLNLGPTQARNVHPGFQQSQSEAEKQQQRVSFHLVIFLWKYLESRPPPISLRDLLRPDANCSSLPGYCIYWSDIGIST
jgi:CCR4-NOT transcription complex subunit 2